MEGRTGWIISVLLEGETGVARAYFAVARPDRARAEWAACDLAMTRGRVATSPKGGAEPVEAVAELPARLVDRFGLRDGEIRDLGERWPRRWLGPGADQRSSADER